MWPLIRGGRDSLEVNPVSHEKDLMDQIKAGDIIIFRRSDGAFVVHRVWKIVHKGQGGLNTPEGLQYLIQTYGDNCVNPDTPVRPEAVCGIVTGIHRGDKCIDPSGTAARTIGTANRNLIQVRRRLSGMHSRITGKNDS